MAAQHDTWFETEADGARLFFQAWRPERAKAVLLVVHGMGEHGGRYAPHAERFAAKDIAVYTFDHRGHGESSGKRGHTPSYADLLRGVDQAIAVIRSREDTALPLTIWGHSMGGNIALAHAITRKPTVAKLIMTAPFLKLPKEPPALQLALGKLMDKIYPALTQATKLDPQLISTLPDEVQQYIADPLVHDRISARWFLGAVAAAEMILDRSDDIPAPLLLMHGSGDGIVSVEGSRLLAQRAGATCRYIEYPDVYHELHNDRVREQALGVMEAWIEGRPLES